MLVLLQEIMNNKIKNKIGNMNLFIVYNNS